MRVGSPLRWEGDCGAERDSEVPAGGREGSLLPERKLVEARERSGGEIRCICAAGKTLERRKPKRGSAVGDA
jgi:hypothetical protein